MKRGWGRRRRDGRRRLRTIRPWCEQASDDLRREDRPDAGLVEQLWCEQADVAEISRASSRSSAVSCWIRRARAFSASWLPRARGRGARRGGCAETSEQSPSGSGSSSRRNGSEVVTSSARSWQSAAVLAITAPSRAAISARSASRSPLLRGTAGRLRGTLLAARTASSASVLPPERRSRRPADLEHPLTALDELAGQARAEGGGAFNGERAPARPLLLGEPKRLRVAIGVCSDRRLRTRPPPCAPRRLRACARRGAGRRRSRSPVDPRASRIDLQPMGPVDAGLGKGNRWRHDCDGSRPQRADRLLIRPASGRQAGASLSPGHITGKTPRAESCANRVTTQRAPAPP